MMVSIRVMRLSLTLFALTMAAGNALAQTKTDLSGFYMISRSVNNTKAQQSFIDELPKDVVLLEDTGPREFGTLNFGGLKPKPHALEEAKHWDPKEELKPQNACKVPSVIYIMQAPFPIEIDQGRDIIVMRLEYYDQIRIIYLDGRDHLPADAEHTGMGNSIGHWEGDTLVVDTTHIKAGTIANNGLRHTENVHLMERFRLSPDGKQLWLTQVFEDPENLDNRGARFVVWNKKPGQHVFPYECDPFSYTQ